MKSRVLLATLAGSLLISSAASAESYYVRNRPFNQVIKAGSEAMVSAEAFLKAVGVNWTCEGNVVTLTDKPAANPPITGNNLTFKYGNGETMLEGSQRSGSTYVALKPLARLLEYSVSSNSQTGTVDVIKARFATSSEKQLNDQAMAARDAEQQALKDAWAKKAAELKQKREAAKPGEEKPAEGGGEQPADGGKAPENGKPAAGGKGEPATPPPPPEGGGDDKGKDDKKEVVKEARLEVFRQDATPDPANGIVVINCEIKNMGDAVSKPVSGSLILKGPDSSTAATNAGGQGKTKVWFSKSVSGPTIQPGASWTVTEKYRHPSGNSMPVGNITAEFKLNSTK